MKVLILGRLQRVMDNVIKILEDAEVKADGVLTDEEAYTLLESNDYKAIVIGGGIGQQARDNIRSIAIQKKVEIIEVILGNYSVEDYYRNNIVPRLVQSK